MDEPNRITVEKRNDDYIAFINGDRALWGNGQSPYEAIGNCVASHGDPWASKWNILCRSFSERIKMKLYIWTDAPVGPKPKRGFQNYDEVFIAVVADTFELAVATVKASYLAEYGAECPYDLREDNVHETIYPAHKKAYIQQYDTDGG